MEINFTNFLKSSVINPKLMQGNKFHENNKVMLRVESRSPIYSTKVGLC